jgi:hypothetical protein
MSNKKKFDLVLHIGKDRKHGKHGKAENLWNPHADLDINSRITLTLEYKGPDLNYAPMQVSN